MEIVKIFAEAAAIPSHPRKGRIITPGLASESSSAKVGVVSALDYVRRNQERFEDLFGGKPYINVKSLIRQDLDTGKPVTSNADVDVTLHVPPHVNAAYMAAATVIAIVMMQWRLTFAPVKWSAVGSFDTRGRLYGYPISDDRYVIASKDWGFTHLLLPTMNADQLQEAAARVGGIEVVGCDNMFEMVQAVVAGGDFTTEPEV